MSTATSSTSSTSAPGLVGAWIHQPSDPEGTERNFQYQAGARAESLEVEAAMLRFNGRTFPVAEFGDAETEAVALSVQLDMDDEHDAAREWWRTTLRARALVCYRDNRGRVVFGVLSGKVGLTDVASGTTVSVTVNRVDYTEGA